MVFFGFFLFVFGQWGEGDARLLAGISFLLPFHPFFQTYFPFPLIFVFNLFLVGTVYMLIYAFVFSLLRSKKIFSIFKNEIKKRKKILTSFFVLIFIFLSSISYFLSILLGIRFSFDFVFLSIFSSLSIAASWACNFISRWEIGYFYVIKIPSWTINSKKR